MVVGKRTFSITELVPQNRRGPSLFCNVHSAFPLVLRKNSIKGPRGEWRGDYGMIGGC
jgi:hypothetical protein